MNTPTNNPRSGARKARPCESRAHTPWNLESGIWNFPRRRRGFTLIEVLIAVAIVSMVIVASTTLIFSMGELWGRNSDVRLFDLHSRNVTRFLESELASAALPPTGGTAGAQSSTSSTAAAPVTIQEVRDQTGNSDLYLTYELPNGSRLCVWPDRALPGVVCSLACREGEGLILLWHSRLETNFDIDAPRETVITPLVTGMTYDYYDIDLKTWKNETVLRKDNSNQGVLPQRIRLTFTYSGRTLETVIDIPGAPPQGLPML
ncbi:prepilin-type N-terminal cleavage/methylation domain-containing protein [Ereboglobus sp. PH5-10]|nr:prepilin-type N-terminal cleavage/methylation domain-containing protein [Ereboglobus sp. PH5-10]